MRSSTLKQSGRPASPVFNKVGENLYRLDSSGTYYAFLKRAGKQFHRSLKTTDRKLAERRLAELRQQIGNLSLREDASVSFADVARRWLDTTRHALKASSITRRETCIKNLTPFFKGVTLRHATARHCERWLTERGMTIAPQTFAHELNTMNGVFNFAVRQGLILANPARDIQRRKIPQARITIPTRQQFQQLVATIRHSDGRQGSQRQAKAGADLVELLAYSGCRIAEARSLRWSDVNFERNCLTITGGETGTKNHESRTVPMTGALQDLLLRMRPDPLPDPQGLISPVKDAKKCLQTACTKLNFPKFTHHDFRHFFATTCIEAGVDIPTISKWLGHKDGGALAMKVYGHLRQEHSFAMIKRVSFSTEVAANVAPIATATT
ncbi:MAG: site-specific integrase [Proteobacteria bacterium]|nr:site-specific integrase [Pseudomonadota bacterium]